MDIDCVYLYLLSPLHTGGTTQEGNLVGIARESHTQLPYLPSSSIRGRLRASIKDIELRTLLFGPELKDITGNNNQDENKNNTDTSETLQQEETLNNSTSTASQLEQGDIWIGDGSLLWIPVPSLSHGVVWVSCPMLLKRWARLQTDLLAIPSDKPYITNIFKEDTDKKQIFLKDARITADKLSLWSEFDDNNKFIPRNDIERNDIEQVLLLPDRHFATITQMSLWRQVKIKLDEHKSVDGGFRYEEAIPPDTLMYFPWGVTSQVNNKELKTDKAKKLFEKRKELAKKYDVAFQADNQAAVARNLLIKQLQAEERKILQIGGQESLGRGFVQQWLKKEESKKQSENKKVVETQKS
jgi:CRISPR-associated protein Cmr4